MTCSSPSGLLGSIQLAVRTSAARRGCRARRRGLARSLPVVDDDPWPWRSVSRAAGNFWLAVGRVRAAILFCGSRSAAVYLQHEKPQYAAAPNFLQHHIGIGHLLEHRFWVQMP